MYTYILLYHFSLNVFYFLFLDLPSLLILYFCLFLSLSSASGMPFTVSILQIRFYSYTVYKAKKVFPQLSVAISITLGQINTLW